MVKDAGTIGTSADTTLLGEVALREAFSKLDSTHIVSSAHGIRAVNPKHSGAELAYRIDAGDRRLTTVERKGGATMRIIELVAPFGGEAEMQGQVG